MHIRVNLKPNPGACVYVYVWSDEASSTTACYRFRHTNQYNSLSSMFVKPISLDRDFYINYTSKVSLQEWIKKVETSEFNDHKQYHLLTHNCAYAANFALEAAGIKLFDNKPYVFINRIFDIPFFRISLAR